MTQGSGFSLVLLVFVAWSTATASAQIVEAVGTRALGMGGAFVAVANDSSATWWNPAGLAAGPFLDGGLAWARTETGDHRPARRERLSSFALGIPPFGFSYYRLRITDIGAVPTARDPARRQDGLAGVPVRSLYASQLGATFVQTLFPGVHAGTTLKYVRGTLLSAPGDDQLDRETLLDTGEAFEGGEAQSRFDLDVGVIATSGPVRVGGVVRNVREPAFVGDQGVSPSPERVRIPRQFRVGAAFDAEAVGTVPLTIALDADVLTYPTQTGDRRVVAVGAEQWLFTRRLALRAGGRFNTVGGEERAATAGATIRVRSGMYVDGHLARGGAAGEQGWGLSARVSF